MEWNPESPRIIEAEVNWKDTNNSPAIANTTGDDNTLTPTYGIIQLSKSVYHTLSQDT